MWTISPTLVKALEWVHDSAGQVDSVALYISFQSTIVNSSRMKCHDHATAYSVQRTFVGHDTLTVRKLGLAT